MALTPQSFVQTICDYIPRLRAPYAQRIFGRTEVTWNIRGGEKKNLLK